MKTSKPPTRGVQFYLPVVDHDRVRILAAEVRPRPLNKSAWLRAVIEKLWNEREKK